MARSFEKSRWMPLPAASLSPDDVRLRRKQTPTTNQNHPKGSEPMTPSEGITPQDAASMLPDSPTQTLEIPARHVEAEAAPLEKVSSASENAPVSAIDRIRNMDVLRGAALLGI